MSSESNEIVCVVGAGLIGQQIALQSAFHGLNVRLHDICTDTLERMPMALATMLNQLARDKQCDAREKERILGRVRLTQDAAEAALAREVPCVP